MQYSDASCARVSFQCAPGRYGGGTLFTSVDRRKKKPAHNVSTRIARVCKTNDIT